MADTKLRNVLFGTMLVGGMATGASGCSPKESDGKDQEKPETEVAADTVAETKVNDPYGNIALFEATRSKIKFALAFCENYFPYVYNDNAGRGAWTTGHGLTILYNADGTYAKVTKNTPVPTLAQSDVYKGRYLTYEILPDIKKHITVPMDENTMIAACVLRYCIGGSNFKGSAFVKQLNSGVKGAALAKTLTGWRTPDGIPKRMYFFAALMAGKIQYSDLLDLRAEGCYNLTYKDIFVYDAKGKVKKDKSNFYEWNFANIQKNLEKAKGPKSTVLWLHAGKGGKQVVHAKLTKDVVPDYIWQEVSNGVAIKTDTISFADAAAIYNCDAQNDSSYIAYKNGDYETALVAGKFALQLAETDKQRGAANYNIGITYLAMGKYEKAVKYLRLSLAANKTKACEDALKDAMQKRQSTRTKAVAYSLLGAGTLAAVLATRRRFLAQRYRHR